MSITLYNDDCLEKMKDLSDNSIDLLFCDLPYCGTNNNKAETTCKWNTPIDLSLFWKEINRVCRENAPMFFTCSTKFGVSLINSNPKNFRYDLVWVKSAPCGFLNAKKMPMKKHEMIYVFYRKLPFYDLSSHKHKFIKETPMGNNPDLYGRLWNKDNEPYTKTKIQNKYDPPVPTSVIKTELYSNEKAEKPRELYRQKADQYNPPLPHSVIRTDDGCNSMYGKETAKVFIYDENGKLRNSEPRYDPPLPNSVIETQHTTAYGNNIHYHNTAQKNGESIYDPPLPNSLLEIKSQKGKHATQKPVDLIKWCLKYYSKEGDVVLDPTMGSGSTGVACKEMNRNFIGIELDKDIFKIAQERNL